MSADPETTPPIADLVRRVAGAGRPAQLRGLQQLGRLSLRPGIAVQAFNALSQSGEQGPRLALEMIARMPDPVPPTLVLVASPLLAARTISWPLRAAVAARFLASLPDRPEAVGPIVRAVVAGVRRGRALERMIELQSRVEKCEALDRMIAASESKVRLKCPECRKAFSRTALIRHLWKRHQCTYDRGQILRPATIAEKLVQQSNPDQKPDTLDSVFLTTPHLFPRSEPAQALQGIVARHWRSSDQYAVLADRAGLHHAGLCPTCYAAVPDPIPPLPTPLTLGHGVLAGDGFLVQITDGCLSRRLRTEGPEGLRFQGLDAEGRWSPRAAGVLIAFPFALLALLVAAILPADWDKPPMLGTAIWLIVISVLAYLAAWAFRKPLIPVDDRAIDVAWNDFIPGIGRTPAAVQFITRLCRASLAHGDPTVRAVLVEELANHSRVLSDKGSAYATFHAAAATLRAADYARIGRDVVREYGDLLAGFFRGDFGPAVVESMAEMIQTDARLNPVESLKLKLDLTASAYAAGWLPADLVQIRRFLPFLAGLLNDDSEGFRLKYTVWQSQRTRPWESAGEARTIFELIREKPAVATRILRKDADALLVYQFQHALDDLLGAVTIGRAGVTFGGVTVANPDAEISVVRTRDGGDLTFGTVTFALPRRPPDSVERILLRFLRYRAGTMMVGQVPDGTSGRLAERIAALNVRCPQCGTASLIRSGQLGVVDGT